MEEVIDVMERDRTINSDTLPATPSVTSANSEFTSESAPAISGYRLPLARIRRLIKLDPQVSSVSSDAVSLASVATEMFCEHLAKQASIYADREKRKTILYKDVCKAINSDERLGWAKEIVPEAITFAKALEAQKKVSEETDTLQEVTQEIGQSTLDTNPDTLPLE